MDPQSASSSSAISRNNYDVFLSFRGIDTRTTIISHLYLALCSKGLYTFKDSEELEAGQRRSELFDAIEGSRIAILMFSENYARSKWCLDELHKIMDLKGQGKLTVVPIFYHVSPREIRMHEKDNGDKGCCQIAMEEMEETYGKDSETVKRWRKALWEGGDLIGFPLYHGQDEGIVVRDVVESVFKILNRVSLEVAKYPVGIDRHLAALRPLLHIDPHVDDVWMIGIHGQGGAGKTTISKAICNHIADRFDSWCFLPNVRETTSRAGLAQLQETLLRELLFDKGLDVSSVDAGKRLIKERLRNKRVLVILDDVDECNQLDALAGDVNWFGKGSRIIITTRNKHVLTSYGMEVYELNLLEKEEADHLFQLHAFGEKKEKINVDGDHINQFVEYAGRLPLALVVLGAFLRGRSECEWEGKLKELAVSPDCTINTVLKISFDGLEENHREMFLDVACFYKGWQIDKVEAILDSCWFSSSIGLAILVERCLITIVDECVEMHDLLAAMGQSIVRDEYLKGNGMLSRVWLYEDFLDILSEDRLMQERQAVKGIVLDYFGELDGEELDGEELDGELIKSNFLKGFNKLKVLIFWNRHDVVYPVNLEGPQWFPRELRWLQWPHYLAPAIEFDPSCKLVHLYLPSSKVRQIKAKGLKELKYVNLSGCSSLEMLPNLSGCRKLEDLRLDGCTSLTKLDEAIGSLENLVCLNLARCSELMTIPSLLRSKRLKSLDFYDCLKLKKLPAVMEEQKFLEVLHISKAVVNELPDSISNLVAVKKLVLDHCQELTTIPSSIYRMQALEQIKFYGCKKLSVFPRNDAVEGTDVFGFPNLVSFDISHCVLKDLEFLDDLTCFETLKNLALSHNKFTRVPASISRFKNLEYLWLDWCDRLVEVTELPNVPYIIVANCQHLKTFPSLNTFICRSPESFRMELSGCRSLDSGYIERSLQFEHVRGFVGAAHVGYPGEEFPKWVKFQTRDCHSRYLVSIPPNISRDDLLGLALFISFDPKSFHWESSSTVHVKINGVPLFSCMRLNLIAGGGVHSSFFYIPGKPIVKRDSCGIAVELNGLDIVHLEIAASRVELRRLGIHLLCEREEDDDLIKVCRDEEDGDEGEGDST